MSDKTTNLIRKLWAECYAAGVFDEAENRFSADSCRRKAVSVRDELYAAIAELEANADTLLRARIAALEAVVAAKPTCACARAERLQAEVDGLRVEVDLLTAERNALRQTLLSACACGEATT